MVSKLLASKVAIQLHRQYWKPGVSNRKTSGKTSKNQFRNSSKNANSKGSCPPKPPAEKCPLPDPNVCEPPPKTTGGRAKGLPELAPCDPDCLKGKPNLPPRGCLPWEKGIELCPGKKPARKLESATCQHICEPYVGQGFIDKLKVSTCEYRRFEKCFDKNKKAKSCLGLGPSLGPSRKEYPMMHAVQKKYLAGCPITSHHFVKPKNDSEC